MKIHLFLFLALFFIPLALASHPLYIPDHGILEVDVADVDEEMLVGCTNEYDPVCGYDGVTYENSCYAWREGVEVAYEGKCEPQIIEPPCPLYSCRAPPSGCYYAPFEDENGCPTCGVLVCGVDCPRIWDPVCGVDGETYTNDCYAKGAGVDVAYNGRCDDDVPSVCPLYYLPVCGEDGETYSNECFARAARVDIDCNGKCPCDECETDDDCPSIYCFTKPCPQPYCDDGKCVTDSCGNGVCEESEKEYCPACTNYDPPCMIACRSTSCPADCSDEEYCGDGVCQRYEKICMTTYPVCDTSSATFVPENCVSETYCDINCPEDCEVDTCGNGICEETEENCVTVCPMCIPGTSSEDCACITTCDSLCDKDCGTYCKDTDGGKEYYIKGTATGRSGVYDDTIQARTDYCVALTGSPVDLGKCSGSNCGVYEFYCVSQNWAPDKSFVGGNIYPCPSGCKDGACLKSKCGNGICEESEKICYTSCPVCDIGMPPEDCTCKTICEYTCEKDCEDESDVVCATYTTRNGKVEACATCGNNICEAYEECTSSHCTGDVCTVGCGPLYCPNDCEDQTDECRLVSEGPTRDKYWEKLGLDTSAHPEIREYRIQWFNGDWSKWYTTGVDDVDWKINYDGTKRRVWSYFTDHNHEYFKCPTCGNNRCEEGEETSCTTCPYGDPSCSVSCRIGTCPQDCTDYCVACAAPPPGCRYEGGSCKTCGELVCEGSIDCVECPAPEAGCYYEDRTCDSCGVLVCEPIVITPPCPGIFCPAPPAGCYYVPEEVPVGSCPGCGNIVCDVEVCPEIYQPVCGKNGITFSNKCLARLAEVGVECEGKCPCVKDCKDSCLYGDVCLPIGTRKDGQFCDVDMNLKDQAGSDKTCDNNFECKTNVCVNGHCVKQSIIQKIIEFFSKLFG